MTEAYSTPAPFAMKRDYTTVTSDEASTRVTLPPAKRLLMPAPPRAHTPPPALAPRTQPRKSFYDLPPEIRVQIYKLVLDKVRVHILPTRVADFPLCPHALVRTSHLVRSEVLPIMHAQCAIRATVTDFNFDGMLEWMHRMPPSQEANLCKNQKLSIDLVTTVNDQKNTSSNSMRNSQSLRRWLHLRADKYRPQPFWDYKGPTPDSKTAYEMRRRAKRSNNAEEQKEMWNMLRAIGLRLTSDDANLPATRSPWGG